MPPQIITIALMYSMGKRDRPPLIKVSARSQRLAPPYKAQYKQAYCSAEQSPVQPLLHIIAAWVWIKGVSYFRNDFSRNSFFLKLDLLLIWTRLLCVVVYSLTSFNCLDIDNSGASYFKHCCSGRSNQCRNLGSYSIKGRTFNVEYNYKCFI